MLIAPLFDVLLVGGLRLPADPVLLKFESKVVVNCPVSNDAVPPFDAGDVIVAVVPEMDRISNATGGFSLL